MWIYLRFFFKVVFFTIFCTNFIGFIYYFSARWISLGFSIRWISLLFFFKMDFFRFLFKKSYKQIYFIFKMTQYYAIIHSFFFINTYILYITYDIILFINIYHFYSNGICLSFLSKLSFL